MSPPEHGCVNINRVSPCGSRPTLRALSEDLRNESEKSEPAGAERATEQSCISTIIYVLNPETG